VESQEIVAATALTHATLLHCRRFAHETSTIGYSDTILLQTNLSANQSSALNYTTVFYIPLIRRWSIPGIQ